MRLETRRDIKILDLDIETRPLTYWTPDRPTAEITAIASCWTDDINSMQVHLLGIDDPLTMLNSFVERFNEADMVTGHYLRKFDLPQINGALMEFSLPKLSPKLVCDTKLDMYKKGDIPATQEYLGELLSTPVPKVQMSQHKWRQANRLLPKGIEEARKRVVGDVFQHMALRLKMVELGLLSPPKRWHP